METADELHQWVERSRRNLSLRLALCFMDKRTFLPAPLPEPLSRLKPMPGRCLEAARLLRDAYGFDIAFGWALLAGKPLEHVWNVDEDGRAVDFALAGEEVGGYYGAVLPPGRLPLLRGRE